MKEIIYQTLKDSVDAKKAFVSAFSETIEQAAQVLATCAASAHKIFFFGNGGSAADAQHLAAEFVNRFNIERRPLPALALTTDTSVITSIANDYCFDDIFSKQLRALGRKDDVAIGISTSGNSPNVINGIKTAKELGLYTISFTGQNGLLPSLSDISFSVPVNSTPRIQEVHIFLGHLLCDLSERILFNP